MSPDEYLTVLTGEGFATKRHSRNKDGSWITAGFDTGLIWFTWREVAVRDIWSLAAAIKAVHHHSFPIRGAVHADKRSEDRLKRRLKNIGGRRGETLCRWAMIDLDGAYLPPGEDIHDYPESAIQWAISEYLPPEFHDVTCFWQLSSSAGIKPGLSCHIWFWFDRPISGGDLADYLAVEAPAVDLSPIRNDVQPHYCAPPIFQGGAVDPIPCRQGMMERETDFVTIPVIDVPALKEKAKAAGGGFAALDDAPDFESRLACIGDDTAGFHEPIRQAIYSAVAATRLQAVDGVVLKGRVREAINAAHKNPGRDVTRYLSDQYLDGSIQGAIRHRSEQFIDNQFGDVAEQVADIEPFYPAITGTLRAAELQIKMFLDRFVAAINEFNKNELTEAEWQFQNPGEPYPTPPEFLQTSPPGTGKSHVARSTAIDILDAAPGRSVGFAVGHHRLSAEYNNRFLHLFDGTPYKAAVFRGRGADDPNAPTDDPERPFDTMCRLNDEAAAISAAGGDVERMLCRDPKSGATCPHYEGCSYQAQKKVSADVWIFAHNLLTGRKPKCIGDLAAVFVDENPADAFLAGLPNKYSDAPVTITIADLLFLKSKLNEITQWVTLSHLTEHLAEMDGDTIAVCDLVEAGLSVENLSRAIKGVWSCKREMSIRPDMTRKQRKAEVESVAEDNRIVMRAARFLDILRGAIERGSEIVPGVRLSGQTLTLRWKETKTEAWNVPTMYMDATGRPETYRALSPGLSEVCEVDCATPNASVRQVVDWNGSRNKLVANPNQPERQNKTALNNAKRIARIAEARADQFRGQGGLVDGKPVDILVVTYQATCEVLKEMNLPANVETIHYGGLAGLDRWKGVRCLILAGWAAKGVDDVEIRAELLKGDLVDDVDAAFPGWYAQELVGGRRRGKDLGAPLLRNYHNDAMAEAVRWEMIEGELLQAIGRCRAVRRTDKNPVQIDVLTNVPLPLEADEFVKWDTIQPTYIDLMAARGIQIDTRQSAKGYWGLAAAALPDVYPNAEAARWADRSRGVLLIGNYLYAKHRVRDFPGAATVKIGRYAVSVRFSADCDLRALFPDAEIEMRKKLDPSKKLLSIEEWQERYPAGAGDDEWDPVNEPNLTPEETENYRRYLHQRDWDFSYAFDDVPRLNRIWAEEQRIELREWVAELSE